MTNSWWKSLTGTLITHFPLIQHVSLQIHTALSDHTGPASAALITQ